MASRESDIFGAPIIVGDRVFVRCLVTLITPSTLAGPGGSADLLTVTVETPGNSGEVKNVTFQVSPVQCRFAGAKYASNTVAPLPPPQPVSGFLLEDGSGVILLESGSILLLEKQ